MAQRTDTTSDFDPGPLSWVQREVDEALARGVDALAAFAAEPTDSGALKHARTHVHQAAGAIHMVGLDAVVTYTDEIERQLARLDDIPADAIAEACGPIDRACRKLRIFLGELAEGALPVPLKLFPEYEAMQRARGVRASAPTDLFYPDLSTTVPRSRAPAMAPAQLGSFLIKQRRLFQRGLLGWLRGDQEGAREMREAVGALEQVASHASLRSFWWSSGALVDALIGRGLDASFGLKQLIARIDLQIRRLSEGSSKVADRLRREVLYYVAISAPVTPALEGVQKSFGLAGLIPSAEVLCADLVSIEPHLREAHEQLGHAKETWLKFTSGRAENLPRLKQTLASVHKHATQTGHGALMKLTSSLVARLDKMSPGNVAEPVAMEYATALLLADSAFQNFGKLSPEFPKQVDVMLGRLDAAQAQRLFDADEGAPILEEMSRRAQDRLLLAQVGREIQANLRHMEQVLDAFFRDHGKRSELAALVKDSAQIRGALRMLELDTAESLLASCEEQISAYAKPDTPITDEGLELLAESLSGLGFYIEAVEQQRTDHERLIAPLLAKRRGEVLETPEPEGDSVEAAVAELRDALPGLVAEVHRAPADVAARQALRAKLAVLRDDAELIGDADLVAQSKAALSELDEHRTAGAALSALVETPAAEPTPEVSHETQRLLASEDHALDAELLDIFLAEAAEVLDTVAEQHRILGHNHGDREALRNVRRQFHTLKGSGRMVGLTQLGEIAYDIEKIHNRLLEEERPVTSAVLALIATGEAEFRRWVTLLAAERSVWPDAEAIHAAIRSVEAELPGNRESVLKGRASEPHGREIVPERAPHTLAVEVPPIEELQTAAESGIEPALAFEAPAARPLSSAEPAHVDTQVPPSDPSDDDMLASVLAAYRGAEAEHAATAPVVAAVTPEAHAPSTALSVDEPRIELAELGEVASIDMFPAGDASPCMGVVEEFGAAIEFADTAELRVEPDVVPFTYAAEVASDIAAAPASAAADAWQCPDSVGEPAAIPENAWVEVPAADSAGAAAETSVDHVAELELPHVALDLLDAPEVSVAGTADAPAETSMLADAQEITAAGSASVELQDHIGTAPELAPEIEPAPSAGPAPATDAIAGSELPDEITVGDVTLSRALYDILIAEADEHLASLAHELALMQFYPGYVVSSAMVRASHTLCGIHRTGGFALVPAAAKALEQCLLALERAAEPLPESAHAAVARAIDLLNVLVGKVRDREGFDEHDAHEVDVVQAELDALRQRYEDACTSRVELMPEAMANAPVDVDDAEHAPVPQPAPVQGDDVAPASPEPVAEAPAAHAELGWDGIADEVDAQLLPIFLEEAEELFPQAGEELRAWRRNPSAALHASALRRTLHTFKGSARMAGAMRLGELAHRMESRLLRDDDLAHGTPELFDALDADLDRIAFVLDALREGRTNIAVPWLDRGEVGPQASQAEVAPAVPASVQQDETPPASAVVVPLPGITLPEAAPAVAPATTEQPSATAEHEASQRAMLRVRADVIDRLVNEAGEVAITRARVEGELRSLKANLLELTNSVIRMRAQVREIEIQAESQIQSRLTLKSEAHAEFDPLEFDRYTRFQELTRSLAEGINDVSTVQQSLLRNVDEADAALVAQARLSRDVQQQLFAIRTVPFGNLSERLYRILRQVAKEVDKRVSLDIRGAQVELDRSVLEKLVGPLEHLLRNAIDHGIEPADARVHAGKSIAGEIVITVRQVGNEIAIELADDGAGLDLERIRARAVAQGRLPAEARASDAHLAEFIFQPGFSTAAKVTHVSGRGIGMDVVRSEIGALGGRVEVSSRHKQGTTFLLYLPLTLAVAQAVLVRAGGRLWALPAPMVEQVQQIKAEALVELYAKRHVEWQGRAYPFHYLPRLLGETQHSPVTARFNPVLLLRTGQGVAAVHVDEMIGNQEVVVKNIGPQLARIAGIAGATVLGTGEIVLIINPVQLAQRADIPDFDPNAEARVLSSRSFVEPKARAPVAMIVDDSLTVRKITSRLLTREGFDVVTAKDGVEALQRLEETVPDVILLDIEMPRMDGFEFTKTIKSDTRHAHVPVIMITSRTAEKHRNRARELGVDLYLGKPYQEHELLRTLREMLSVAA